MKFDRRHMIAGAAVLALAAGGAGTAVAVTGGDDGDRQTTGPGADRARAAALAHLPGGEVNAVDRDSENGATWEVEVTKSDGRTVDVRLDESYRVIVVEGDTEDPGERP